MVASLLVVLLVVLLEISNTPGSHTVDIPAQSDSRHLTIEAQVEVRALVV